MATILHILSERFHIPAKLMKYADLILSADDRLIISSADESGLIQTQRFSSDALKTAYKRGIINKNSVNEPFSYILADFYTRLEFFMLEDKARWRALPETVKRELDTWYVEAYAQRVLAAAAKNNGFQKEEILPIEIVAGRIDDDSAGQIALQDCDCRLFAEGCDKPVNVCLHFHSERPNSLYDRGYGQLISKDKALYILKQTDDAGLMHLSGGHSVCNCCACCCYPFRAGKTHESGCQWPQVPYVVTLDNSLCIGCSLCEDRCYFNALEKDNSSMTVITEKCRGCGACRPVCPTDALQIINRN